MLSLFRKSEAKLFQEKEIIEMNFGNILILLKYNDMLYVLYFDDEYAPYIL